MKLITYALIIQFLRYLQFYESEKVSQCTPVWDALGQHMGFFGKQLVHHFINIKWSHIQYNKHQHVKIYTLNDFTFQGIKTENILKQVVT